MPFFALFASFAGWIGAASGSAASDVQAVRTMVIRDEMLIHVPIANRRPPLIEWIERKGPQCLPSAALAGASLAGPSTIDFVLRNRRRVRAKLDSECAGLDFYGGFYVEPQDGSICARRDEIRSRDGGSCRIARFRSLEPKLKR